MTQPLTERLRAFAARWRKSMGWRGGYGDEIYEIDAGAPSHVVLTVQMVEQSADLIDALEATQAELVELLVGLRSVFRSYASSHEAKALSMAATDEERRDRNEKAERNWQIAEDIETALAKLEQQP